MAWTLLAERPLSLNELGHAVSIKIGCEDFDEEDLPADNTLGYCLGLVVVEEQRSAVSFMHYTLREYLESSEESVFGIGHEMLAYKCLTYSHYRSIPTINIPAHINDTLSSPRSKPGPYTFSPCVNLSPKAA
jgi:hypothetical protein